MPTHTTNVETLTSPALGSTCALTASQQTHLATDRDNSLRWLTVFQSTFGHRPYLLEVRDNATNSLGHLPLCLIESRLFGRFLVSLPYLNTAGVCTPLPVVAAQLIDRAVELANDLNVQHLELRHEHEFPSPHFNDSMKEKVHMRLDLPAESNILWKQLKPKVRNQIRKGDSHDLTIKWGRHENLRDFYRVFSHNMRDLGTPVYSRALFQNILDQFPSAELAVTYLGKKPIAAAYLHHDSTTTSVPSASCIRRYNPTNANMWMYWQLLSRSIERSAVVFDFGRSTLGGGTYRFKKQWGAQPSAAVWQYYRRDGDLNAARPTNPKYQHMIRIWQRLPLWAANLLGPQIVRGIP
jgi:FemAB-related protein (PEP-CTERM system-associated)